MNNSNLGMKFLEVYFGKSEIASDRLSFLPKMGLEFFSHGLEFFFENAQKSLKFVFRFPFNTFN